MIDDDRTDHDRTVPSFELEPPFTEARRPPRPRQFKWGVLFDSLNGIASLM